MFMAKRNIGTKLPKPVRASRQRAGASRRCLQILEVLAEPPYAFSLADISRVLSMPKSSVHRLMKLLADCGFVDQEPAAQRYVLTPKVLRIGSSYLRNSAVQRSALTLLSQLSEETETPSHLGVWDNGKVLILHTAAPPNAMSLFVDVGERRPVHASAMGKVLLAYRPAGDLKRICPHGLESFTPRTITSLPVMEEELARIREAGFAIDDEESGPGVRCVAAPIRNQDHVVAAMAISGQRSLITDEDLPRIVSLVQEAALRTSAQLGYRPASPQVGTLLAGIPLGWRARLSAEDAPAHVRRPAAALGGTPGTGAEADGKPA
jgi:DNA-binding IclR family transcriptional regulator